MYQESLRSTLRGTVSSIRREHRIIHPMTQGKIERYHHSMKNVIKLQNYYLPSELQREIGEFVE